MNITLEPLDLIEAKIPVIPMVRILQQYARANSLPFKKNNWDCVKATFLKYIIDARQYN